MNLDNLKKVHIVGIGGIGISAVGRWLIERGVEVVASDREETKMGRQLEDLGVSIAVPFQSGLLTDDVDLVVYSRAYAVDENPVLMEAVEIGIPVLTYPEMLGLITKTHPTIAVSGTHGKTTTTAMIAKILQNTPLSPTTIVGSLLAENGSNYQAGSSDWWLIEACEYKRSFLQYQPRVLVITNIEEDHLDYYEDLADIQNAFAELASKLPADGALICNPSDPALQPVLSHTEASIVDYTQYLDDKIELKVPGEHNRYNAAAAVAVADWLGVSENEARSAVADFAGTWRRFEYKGERAGVKVYDDYAHNPTEIRASLAGMREFFGKEAKLVVVFQPHLFSRTKSFLDEFADSFGDVDEAIIVPIYPAREPFDKTIDARDIVERSGHPKIHHLKTFAEVVEYLQSQQADIDAIMTVGAGDVYRIGEMFLEL